MIHVVGNATLDTLIRLDRFPQPGETVVARGADEDLGGKGANQAIVIARCGQSVRLRAALGADPPGERIRRALILEGVGDGLTIWPGPTDRCVIYVDSEGENTIVSLIEAARAFDPVEDLRRAGDVAPGDWLLMQGNLSPAVTRACLALAKERGALTALNPSPTYEAAEYDWRLVDLAVVNRVEAMALGGGGEPIEAALALRGLGAGVVALTLGAEGAALIGPNRMIEARAPRVEAIDTVGAGDVFCGMLIAARVAGRDWCEALGAAVAAAAVSVTRRGVLASFPTRGEMAALLSRSHLEEHPT
jgi:ribokinase